jgi:hypothetical protein
MSCDALRQLLAAGLAIPFLERFVGNLSVHQQLRELPPLRLALEWHDGLTSDLFQRLTRVQCRRMRQ